MTHTHGSAPPHEHEGAAPGHTHDTAPDVEHAHGPEMAAAPSAVDVGPTAGGVTTRILLTALGGAGLIIGGFLPWFRFGEGEAPPGIGLTGIDLSNSVFYSTDDPFGASFVGSAGLVVIALGILALLGMALRSGWLTTLAGVLGIIAFALVLITLYRVPDAGFDVSNVGYGLWIVLAGGVIAVFGGFFGARPRAMASATGRF
jgi:hypothetical protein